MDGLSEPIFVTKTFLPPREEYDAYLDSIWATSTLTNQGPLLKQFEQELAQDLDVKDYRFHFVSNGTTALRIALKALGITSGEVITTPFTYVATTSSIMWERCKPVFVDIDPETLCIDPRKIEEAITKKTKAIMPVHVFGIPCDIEEIQRIADKHGLKVIYDAAHAFGVEYKGRSAFEYGDISIASFHSTKLFHTIEGGGVFIKDKAVDEHLELIKRFGHNGDDHVTLGINAKASEFQAAMGLCNLKYVDEIVRYRKKIADKYTKLLGDSIWRPRIGKKVKYNYAYYPVVFDSPDKLRDVLLKLNAMNIFPRRYFFPSLNQLPYLKSTNSCPVSEDVSRRIACLPMYHGMTDDVINKICKVINET